MKLLSIIFLVCLLTISTTFAQQPKAYEVVNYTAKIEKMRFHLQYADGYLAATRLSLTTSGQNTRLFTPVSGVPDNKGNFMLQSKSKASVTLNNINETDAGPEAIKAIYRNKNRQLTLLFKQSGL